MKKLDTKKRIFGLLPSYGILKKGEKKYKIVNFQRNVNYWVEKKDVFFKKSGKTWKIWTCSCPSYKKWSWRTHSCKHIDMLKDTGDIK